MMEVEATDEGEANARQLAELEFIQSAYTSKEAWVVVVATEENEGSCSCRSVVRLLHLPVVDDLNNWTPSNAAAARNTSSCQPSSSSSAVVTMELNLTMPLTYPIRSHLVITGTVRTAPSNPTYIRKAAWNALPVLVQFCQTQAIEFATIHDGGEAVWHVLNCADEWIHTTKQWYDILRGCRQQSTFNKNVHQVVQQIKSADVTATDTTATTDRTSIQILGRRIIYSHHIISSTKRKDLRQLATHYKLGGYMKIGWPGIIIIEGHE